MDAPNNNFLGDNDFESDEEITPIEVETISESKSSPSKTQDGSGGMHKKEKKSGVVYLSSLPTSMNIKKLSEEFSKYGELGRIYLKPEENCPGWKKNRKFSEGWVEFSNKKGAKMVATTLNNNQVGGKRHNPWYYDLWNIKYLKRFKWLHLNEKMNSERAARKKKLKMEISLAKKETGKFKEIVERERVSKKKEGRKGGKEVKQGGKVRIHPFTYKQQKPSYSGSNKSDKVKANDDTFLNNIFSGGFA